MENGSTIHQKEPGTEERGIKLLKIKMFYKEDPNYSFSCDNCNLEPESIYRYSIIDKSNKEYTIATLCDKCSRKLSKLHGICPITPEHGRKGITID